MRKFDTRSVPARHLDWLKGEGMFREKEEGKEGRGDGGKKRETEGRKEGERQCGSDPHSGMTEHWFALTRMWMDNLCQGLL